MNLPRPPVSAVAVASAAMLFLLLLRPVYDVDVFWRLRLGELSLAQGGPVRYEPFAVSHVGEPMTSIYWLGHIVYSLAWKAGGWPAVRALDALALVSGFWVIGAAVRRAGAPVPAVLVALGVGFMAAMPCASLRPQSFAALGLGVALAVLRMNPTPVRGLSILAVTFVLWQNLHPSVGVAAIVFAAAAAVGWLRRVTKRRPERPWLTTGGAALAGLAVFVTPDGVGILALTAYNAQVSAQFRVNEWLPAWDPSNYPASLTFAVAALVAGWLIARNWRRVDLEEAAPAAALFVLTLAAHRFALFWGIAIVPVLARCLTPEAAGATGPAGQRWVTPVTGALLMLAVVGLAGLVRPTWFYEALPMEGVSRLRATGVRGVIYCHHLYGGPVIGAGYPDWLVAFDGRYYLYSPEEWDFYLTSIRGEVSVEEIEHRYHPVAFFLRPGADAGLIRRLEGHPDWQRVYEDRVSCAFVRAPRIE